jgi:hypothetical protein
MWERLGGIHPLPPLRCSAPLAGKMLRLSRSGSARLRSLAAGRLLQRSIGFGDEDLESGTGIIREVQVRDSAQGKKWIGDGVNRGYAGIFWPKTPLPNGLSGISGVWEMGRDNTLPSLQIP